MWNKIINMKVKTLIRRIFQRQTSDFIEFIEVFSNGDIEIALYYHKK